MDPIDRLIRRADELVTEVVAPYRGILPDELIETIRAELMAELIIHPDGRAALRRTMADLVVEMSGTAGHDPVEDDKEDIA